ncbi:MAG: PIN domain-containing protein [Thermodesulfobacteriota bacterium]|jgi:predicted nucleic acid-binding protein
MQRNLKDFSGKEPIFIDANIFLHHAFDLNSDSIEFLKKVETVNMKAFTSALVIEEITFKLIMQSASNFLSRVTLPKVKDLLKDKLKREKVIAPVEAYRSYINSLKDLGLKILDLTDEDMKRALQISKAYGLVTADASHVAVMERTRVSNLATGDSDFRVLKEITVWSPESK